MRKKQKTTPKPRLNEENLRADILDAIQLVAQLHGRKAEIDNIEIKPCNSGARISVAARFVRRKGESHE